MCIYIYRKRTEKYVLMNPMKRRMLLKMLAVGAFLNRKKEVVNPLEEVEEGESRAASDDDSDGKIHCICMHICICIIYIYDLYLYVCIYICVHIYAFISTYEGG
jgi:hypothetical protein